jgi:hypothetical protein
MAQMIVMHSVSALRDRLVKCQDQEGLTSVAMAMAMTLHPSPAALLCLRIGARNASS